MNEDKIDKQWREFARKNKLKLSCTDKSFFEGIKTKYKTELRAAPCIIILTGALTKSNQGYNLEYTRISITGIPTTIPPLEVIDKRILLMIKNKYKDSRKQQYLNLIRKYEANKIAIEDGTLEIEFDYIFDSSTDFEKIELINEELIRKPAANNGEHEEPLIIFATATDD